MYTKALRGMRKHMLTQLWMGDDIGDIWIVAENDNGAYRQNVLEHLTCFLPGTMALGAARERHEQTCTLPCLPALA